MPQQRALVITAHPDDPDFGAAGTLAGWVEEGFQVTVVLCTRGEQGGFDEQQHLDMPQIREREQRAASGVLGITDVRFLDGHRDGWLEPTYALQKELVRIIRQVRPGRMIIQSAERSYERIGASHPDHLAAGEAAIRAIYPAAENQFAWPELLHEEGLEPFRVPEFWVLGHPRPSHLVDITDRFDTKVEVLRRHVSQTSHHPDLPAMLRRISELTTAGLGLAPGRVGEAFLRVRR